MIFGYQRPYAPRNNTNLRRPAACARPGFTLAEMLLALVITIIVTLAMSCMVQAVSDGTTLQQDGRQSLTSLESLQARLHDLVRTAHCILAVSGPNNADAYMVLWTDNANPLTAANPFSVDLANLCLLQYNPTTHQVDVYQVPYGTLLGMGAVDQEYPADTQWYGVMQAFITRYHVQPAMWSDQVAGMEITSDAARPVARLGNIALTIHTANGSQTSVLAGAVENFQAPQ